MAAVNCPGSPADYALSGASTKMLPAPEAHFSLNLEIIDEMSGDCRKRAEIMVSDAIIELGAPAPAPVVELRISVWRPSTATRQ